MKTRNIKKRALAAVTLGALATLPAAAVQADDTSAEIRLLKARLRQLEEKVARQDREQKETKAQVRKVAAHGGPVCKDAACPPPPPPVFVSFANGLKVESLDHDFSFKVGGRIFVDGGGSTRTYGADPRTNPPFLNAFFHPNPLLPFGPVTGGNYPGGFKDQVGFRQARLEVEGKAFKYWFYKFQYDFAQTGGVPGFRDVFIALRYFEPFTIQVGSMFEPSGLERQNSSKYRDFLERALASELLTGNRHIGAAVGVGGEAPGILGKSNWSAKGGVFSTSFEDLSLTPLNGGGQYYDLAGRLTYAPILTEDALLHLGGSVRYERVNDSTALSNDKVLAPGNSLRTEAAIVGEGLLGTPALSCSTNLFTTATGLTAVAQRPGWNCTKDVLTYGAELVASYGPVSVQAEYFGQNYSRTPWLIAALGAPGGTQLDFSGYYVYATWYLTGESRAASYLTYPKEFNTPGTFGQINIKNPLSAGGWGAWELAARLSEINLNSGGIVGGRETDFTLGLNWYPDKGFRVMANWVRALQVSPPFDRPYLNGVHPNIFVMRAQVDW
jgi:phosphate-selective porin OprO/OprP